MVLSKIIRLFGLSLHVHRSFDDLELSTVLAPALRTLDPLEERILRMMHGTGLKRQRHPQEKTPFIWFWATPRTASCCPAFKASRAVRPPSSACTVRRKR